MSAESNRIYRIAKQLCKNLPEDVPEGILYGIIKLAAMNDDSLKSFLSASGIEDTEGTAAELRGAMDQITEKGLDVTLMRNGLQILIPDRAGDAVNVSSYNEKTEAYTEETGVRSIVDDCLDMMPGEELDIFRSGNSLQDVMSYHKKMVDDKPVSGGPAPKNDGRTGDFAAYANRGSEKSMAEGPAPEASGSMREMYSDILTEYLQNLKEIIPTFKSMNNVQILWSKSLLVSIDDGFGLSTFVEEVYNIYNAAKLVKSSGESYPIMEVTMEYPDDREHRYASWDKLIEYLDKLQRYNDTEDKLVRIVSVDISKWTGELATEQIKSYLRMMADLDQGVLMIFRIPYMEHRIVSDIRAELMDVLAVKPLIVTPATNDQMIRYMITKASKYEFGFDEDCRDILERGIIAEKNDGTFYGFRTLGKMVQSIIYEKISADHFAGNEDRMIHAEELKTFLDIPMNEKTAEEMLKDMVGVESIAEEIDSLINQIKVQRKMVENGRSVDRPTLHMCFMGSPGTGKTTMARIVAKKMKDAGILSKGNFYEIKGRDLCGRYIGETTPKTCSYCRTAYGSVLFIDEAYQLYNGAEDSKDYGREAITALIAEMENHRDDMCVILAGYTDEMKAMLEGNIGFASRVKSMIEFPNYSREDLESIFFKMLADSFEYDDEFKGRVHDYFGGISEDVLSSKSFANGRFVRNIYEGTWEVAALRQEFSESGKLILNSQDFISATEKTDINDQFDKKSRPLGFGSNWS